MARNLQPSFYGVGGLQESPLPPVVAKRSPVATDINYEIGQSWINTVSHQAWIYTGAASGAAVWALSSPGASDVDTVNGLSPLAGNITIAGGTNVTDVNVGSTVTLNLNPAISLATSVTSPLYTSGAGVTTAVSAPANQNIVLKMGDAAGATKISFVDSASAEKFAVTSAGVVSTLLGETVTGNFAQTGGTFNVGQDNAANAINIGGGTTARAVGIANSAAAHVLTLGSTTGAAQTTVQSGTVGLALNAAGAASPLTLDSVGVLELNSSAGVIGIGNDAVAQNINVGTGAAARTLTLGNVTGATAVNVNTGTGGSLITTTNGTFEVDTGTGALNLGTDAAAKTITIGNSTGATSVVVNCGTGALNVGTNAIAHAVTIGNVTGATAVNINTGTGGSAVTTTNGAFGLSTGTGAINLGTDAAAKTMTLGNVTGATAVNINTGTGGSAITTTNGAFGLSTGTGAINVGTDAAAKTLTLGNITGATAVNVNTGTGGSTWTTTNGAYGLVTGTGAINIGADAAAKTITLGNATGATSVVVNSGTGAASFGANATAHTTTVGSTTGASALVLQGGTGRITMTGTVKEVDADFVTRTGVAVTFQSSPLAQSNANTGVAPTGVTGDVNLLHFQEGFILEEFVKGAGQTILAPRMNAAGLLVSGDLTATKGWEYNTGAALANSPLSFTIGTSPAFFAEMSFTPADVSGLEPAYFGFRKTQANAADYTTYTDFVGFGLDNLVSTGKVIIQTQLNSGGLVSTDTTNAWVDNATHTLRVLVSAAGVVTFLIDGVAPAVTQAFTFDNGDVVHFFWTHIFGLGAPGAINWNTMKVGFQP